MYKMNNIDCDCSKGKITEAIYNEFCPVNKNEFLCTDGRDSITVKSYTLLNGNVEVVIITWGATIVSIKYPDKYGRVVDVILGFDNLKDYMNPEVNSFIGCILGRCVDKIKNGGLRIEGREYQLSPNDGGIGGFGRRNWDSHIDGNKLIMTYLSIDGEDGYPGTVLTTLTFKLTSENTLDIRMQATTNRPTLINLSYGSLFNLAGHDAGEDELKMHTVSLNCDRFIFTENEDEISIKKSRRVGGTSLDFRIPRLLGDEQNCVLFDGDFGHSLCVIQNFEPGLTFIFRAKHERTGRVLEVFSNQPGLRFDTCGSFPTDNGTGDITYETLDAKQFDELASYTSFLSDYGGRYLRGEEDDYPYEQANVSCTKPRMNFIPGKNGAKYTKFCAFGVHPQNYYNTAINHFPCAIIRPGQVYHHNLIYKFGVQLENSLHLPFSNKLGHKNRRNEK